VDTHVHGMYRLNSLFIHSMCMCMLKLFNLYIRCTCVCESYSIYTFDVHVYAKAIQFTHSMYMCMRKLFNFYIRCIECINWIIFAHTCTSNVYIDYVSYTHVHRMYKLNSFRIHMYIECIDWIGFVYACTSNSETYSIYTFDVHVYAKPL
jgi:hypothetical protein